MRRTLLVPIRAHGPSARRDLERSADRPVRAGSTSASRGSSRGSTPPISSPSGRRAGMSLLLCTARSIVAGQQRVLDLLDEQALAADSDSGASAADRRTS